MDRPLSREDWASSNTAPSTQPPETLPTALSSGPTSIEAPGWRGADFQVPTTVPTPTLSPARHHASSSVMTSRTCDHLGDVAERVEAVACDELVDVGQGRQHTSGCRCKAGLAAVWV